MNYAELREALKPIDGTITISADTLTPNIADLLVSCYDGLPIKITGVHPGPDDGTDETLVMIGRSSFLLQDLTVELRAKADQAGRAQIRLKYTLLGSMPDKDAWKFSRSFPKLPKMTDWSKPGTDPYSLPLDDLLLSDASFIVVSATETDKDFKVELKPGINFVSKMRPTGIVSIIESVFKKPEPAVLYGTIRIPKKVETVVPLKELQYPWDLKEPPSGITLQAELGAEVSIGKMTFGKVTFRHYTPITEEWLNKNLSYEPALAYTGMFCVPSAELEVDAVVPYDLGGDELLLIGRFEGFTLKNLTSSLLHIAGSGDVFSRLPKEIKEVGDGIGKLELTHAAIDISYSKETGIELGMASITVGMPELKWKVWEKHFEIDSILCRIAVMDPLAKRGAPEFEITVYGGLEIEGVPVNVSASNRDNFTIFAELAEAQTIPLNNLLNTYAPSIPAPSDLTVDVLRVSVAPFKEYSFAVAMAASNPWVIDLDFTTLKVHDVAMSLVYPHVGDASASFGGEITFFDWATLSLRYDYPGDIEIRGVIPRLKLSEVISKLVNQDVTIPGGFDLEFDETYAMVQKAGTSYAVRMGTQIKDVGIFALEVRKISGKDWGIAAGVDLSTGVASLSKALGPLAGFEQRFGLQKLLLVISSFEDSSFTFPDLAAFEAPQIAGGKLTLPGKGGVIPGFNFFSQWTINTEDREQKLLQQFLGLNPTLGITLQVGLDPTKEARLYLRYDTTIKGLPLSCKFGGQISAGSIGLFLEGDVAVEIQGQRQTFFVKLDFVENGAFVAGTMKGQVPVTISYDDVEIFKIGNMAIAIGCDWEGVPSIGVAGQLEAAGIESSLAVFFDSVEPQKSMVAGSLSDLTLYDVLGALAGTVLPSDVDNLLKMVAVKGTRRFTVPSTLSAALDNLKIGEVADAFAKHGVDIPTTIDQVYFVVASKGRSWFLTDQRKMRHYQMKLDGKEIAVSLEAQLYCVPQRTQIGSLPPFEQDLYLNGAISLFGFNAQATIDINPSQGIAVDAQMDKIVIYSEKFFSIKAAEGKGEGGPQISIATFKQPDLEDPQLRDPHIFINGQIYILGLTRMAYAFLTTSGVEFYLKGQMLPLLYLDAHGRFKGVNDFGFGGAVKIGLDAIDLGPFGTVQINTGVEGTLDIKYDGVKVEAKVGGSVKFAGSTLSTSFELDVRTSDLTDLAKLAWKDVSDKITQFVKEDAARWAEAVYRNFIQDVADVEVVLEKQFGYPVEDAKRIAKEAWDNAKKSCAMTQAALHM